MRSLPPSAGEQNAAGLQPVSDRSEGNEFACGGPRLRGADQVLAHFGKGSRGSFLSRASSAIEPLRPLITDKLGDL